MLVKRGRPFPAGSPGTEKEMLRTSPSAPRRISGLAMRMPPDKSPNPIRYRPLPSLLVFILSLLRETLEPSFFPILPVPKHGAPV